MKHIALLSLAVFALFSCGNAQDHNTEGNLEVQQQSSVKPLDQNKLAAIMEQENVIVIDVRTPGEVSQGYIKGADLFININGADFQREIGKLDKSKTYVMYCRSGARSGSAASYMVQNGFSDVYNLMGGIMNYRGEVVR